jgi:hypothetical protein
LRPTTGTEVGIHGAPFEDDVPILCVMLLTDSDASELIALKLPPLILLIITMGVVACDWLVVHTLGTGPKDVSILSGVMDTLLEGGALSNDGMGSTVMGVAGTVGTTGEASKLPAAEFGVMVSPVVSVSASLLSTSSTMEPLSVVRLSAGLYAYNKRTVPQNTIATHTMSITSKTDIPTRPKRTHCYTHHYRDLHCIIEHRMPTKFQSVNCTCRFVRARNCKHIITIPACL